MGKGGMDDMVGQHFGQVPNYTIVDTETKEVDVIENTSEHRGGIGLPPELLAKAGVHVMLCGGLGQKAVNMFASYDITVYVGASGTVQDALNAWEAGDLCLPDSQNVCQGHDHHHH